MAYFQRLIVFCLCLLPAMSAHALFPTSKAFQYLGRKYGSMETIQSGYIFSSHQEACNGYFAYIKGLSSKPVTLTSCNISGDTAAVVVWQEGLGDYNASVTASPDMCPANSVKSGSQCQCNSGFLEYDAKECRQPLNCGTGQHEENGLCVPDNCKPDEIRVNGLCVAEPACPTGQTRVNGQCIKSGCPPNGKILDNGVPMNSPSPETYCQDTGPDGGGNYCMVTVRNSTDVSYNGKTYYYGTARYTGAKCSGSTQSTGTQGAPAPNGGTTGTSSGTGTTTGTGTGTSGTGTSSGGTGTSSGTGTSTGTGTGTGTSGGTDGTGSGVPSGEFGTDVPPNGTGGTTTGTSGISDGSGTGTSGTGTGTTSGAGTGKAGTGAGSGAGNLTGSPVGTPKPVDGSCPVDTVEKSGQCYPTKPIAPDTDGKCPAGYVKTGVECSPLVPAGAGSTGTGGGGEDGTEFGGGCVSGFSCTGDAIQCAIAKEQHIRACQLMENKTAESELYDREKGKQGKQTGNLDGNETHDLNNRISSVDLLGGGQGMQDLNISVMGSSITLPFSRINPYLSALGNVLLAVSFLMAVRIVGRG